MELKVWKLAAVAVALALASCGDKEPTGQVVATVGKDEITVKELQAELAGFQAPNQQVRKLAEQQALQNIIQRKLLAQAAEKADIAKGPDFVTQKERLEEALLVRAWQDKLVKAVPQPSREEAQKFVAENPAIYAERRIFTLDQLRMPQVDQATIAELQPLRTLEDIEGLLNRKGIAFNRGTAPADALQMPPQILTQILRLPAEEVFVLPTGNVLLVNKIVETKIVPVTGEPALRHATQYLKGQRTQDSIRRQFGSVVAGGMAEVKYNKAYTPPKPPAKGAPAPKGAAPAPAPSAPAAPAPAAPAKS